MPLIGFNNSRAQSFAPQAQPAVVTIYRDLVRFAVGDAHLLRIEIFNQKQEKIFDSDFISGSAFDWFSNDQQGQVVDSGLYSYVISIRKESGESAEPQRGNVILDRERQNLTDAPPQKIRHRKGDITTQTAGIFDVNAAGGSYNINTPRMGIGNADPLARLHVGADTKEPATAGATLLIEDGSQSSMVLKSVTGGEMFLIQNDVGGVIGTGSNSPLSLRTSNRDRVMIDTNGNIGIGTSAPGARLHVSGDGLVSGNLTVSGTLNANLPSGSTNYIQNTGSQQVSAGFNISGSGTLGGTLAASLINATTQYNIGGNRVLSIGGASNIFAGVGAGLANTGSLNSFFGSNAGLSNTAGGSNSFVGNDAGRNNTTGSTNSFFGAQAGYYNTTGFSNAFFGTGSGYVNSTGNSNAFFGAGAGSANTTAVKNSFFGSNAGAGNSTGSSNAFFGADTGFANTTGYNNSFFGQAAGSSNTAGASNSFFGKAAGYSNSTGTGNSFFGTSAGYSNSTGFANSFFGSAAGVNNSTGTANSFFGSAAGNANTLGTGNSFFGNEAGNSNSTADGNSFFGNRAGNVSTTGSSNSFFGAFAGNLNSTGNGNVFMGNSTAAANTTGSRNLIMGSGAGSSNTSENENTFLGNVANGAANITNATAIGSRASVTQSNSLVLGSISGVNSATASVNVGIGTTSPADRLDVSGIIRVSSLGAAGITQLCRNASNQISSCSSSLRYKEQIRPFDLGLELISRLRPVSFNWKAGGERDLGLVAEEVAEIEPLLVTKNEKGQVEGVKYDRINVALVNAIKELSTEKNAQVASLKAENAALQQQNSAQMMALIKQNALLSARLTVLERMLMRRASQKQRLLRGEVSSGKRMSSN